MSNANALKFLINTSIHRLAQQNNEWFEYDSGGRMTRRIVRGEGFRPQIYTYKWNGRSQLTGFIKPNGERWRYRYDALGRRTEKWCGQELRTRYIWDGDTPALIQEYRNGGLVSVRHLVFNGFHLLAQQDCEFDDGDGHGNNAGSSGNASISVSDNSRGSHSERWQTRYAATDLNALPLALYSEEGNRVWRRDRTSLWGLRANKFYYQPEDKLDPGLLFAGQMEDSESGLVYNRFRYYHPESGTYLSPDPIGLAGGENTQAYVPNPLSWVDPLGLAKCDILFGQKRISETFRDVGSDAPDYIRGRSILDVAADLKKGSLHPDQLPVSYFIHPQTGQRIAESNRTLAALSAAGMKPTILKEVPVTQALLARLSETPLRQCGEVFNMPGRAIPVTPGPKNNAILDIIRLPL